MRVMVYNKRTRFMKLIVGLGNPGKKYEGTRHNMGFMAIDLLSDQAQIDVDKEVFHGLMGRGTIRLRKEGSSGGHKGMQNIIDCLSSDQIKRIRVGIGEPGEWDTIDYVLSKPLKDDMPLIEEAIANAVRGVKEYLKSDFDRAMNKYN